MFWFDELDEARKRRKHTPEEACVALHVSRYTWDNWKAGKAPRRAQAEMVRQYMSGGK